MRNETVVVFRLNEEDAERLNPLLPDFMPGVSFRGGAWQVRFHHASEAVRAFARALVEVDVGFDVREERSFRVEEIDRAPALRLHRAPLVRARRAAGDGACEHLVRDVDDSPVRLEEDDAFRLARTTGGDLLVDERIAAALIRERVGGCLLRPVQDAQGATSPYFEIVPVHRLPPMHSPPTRFARKPENVCPVCGRGGLELHSPPFYDCEVEALTDVNATYETFGDGDEAAPGLMLSQKLFRLLKQEGAELEVEPVLFV
ncbi:MAG TPA: hypothetical protein VEI02_02745 [Planctomycetota bacterium]|nr:hypothetical protein [Planctomycetota bacterium]